MTDRRPTLRVARAVRAALALYGCGVLLFTGCASPTPASDEPTRVSAETVGTSASASPTASAGVVGADLSGKTIAIDPGHNGGNAKDPEAIASPVPDGRGGTKACNTTGTATDSDYGESEFAWSVAGFLRDDLEAAGASVILSRSGDDGVGPCVDERGTFADDADVLVSIHANGSESTKPKGFHIIVADPGKSRKLEDESTRLAKSLSGSMAAEFTPNKVYGKDAISPRGDLAGLNNASVPAVIVECGEMRNPDEAAVMESEDGRRRYAEAIAAGIGDWF